MVRMGGFSYREREPEVPRHNIVELIEPKLKLIRAQLEIFAPNKELERQPALQQSRELILVQGEVIQELRKSMASKHIKEAVISAPDLAEIVSKLPERNRYEDTIAERRGGLGRTLGMFIESAEAVRHVDRFVVERGSMLPQRWGRAADCLLLMAESTDKTGTVVAPFDPSIIGARLSASRFILQTDPQLLKSRFEIEAKVIGFPGLELDAPLPGQPKMKYPPRVFPGVDLLGR